MRVGTRASALALAQARSVADALGGCELVPLVTGGDRGAGAHDKSRWVSELERALAAGEIDLAVHSAKDVPGELAPGLELLGAPPRAGAEDVLCGAGALEQLPAGARVGSSSLRRAAQLRAARADLEVVEVRGNVDTRLRKLRERHQGLDAIVLARAGLQRLAREHEAGAVLDPARFVPAPGQGALALQGRAGDRRVREAVAAIAHAPTFACLLAERALARELGASCNTALGAHAQATPAGHAAPGAPDARGAPGAPGDPATPGDPAGATLQLRAWVGLPDGSAWLADELCGELTAPERLGAEVAARLRLAGAEEMLRAAEAAAAG